jgi:hypothetical protein
LARLVDDAGHRPDIVGPRHAHHDVGLLDADLEVAAREIVRHRSAVGGAAGAHRLGLQLLRQPELLNSVRHVSAAAAKGIADRFGRDERGLVGIDRTDVGLWRAGAHRDTEPGQHERRHCAGHHLALLDEIIERLGIGGEQVAGRR